MLKKVTILIVFLCSSVQDILPQDFLNQSLLDNCISGNVKEVQRLLDAGANPDYSVDTIGANISVMNLVISSNNKNKYKIAQLLINAGAEINPVINIEPLDWNETITELPLLTALYNYDFKMIDLLLKNGADINKNLISRSRGRYTFANYIILGPGEYTRLDVDDVISNLNIPLKYNPDLVTKPKDKAQIHASLTYNGNAPIGYRGYFYYIGSFRFFNGSYELKNCVEKQHLEIINNLLSDPDSTKVLDYIIRLSNWYTTPEEYFSAPESEETPRIFSYTYKAFLDPSSVPLFWLEILNEACEFGMVNLAKYLLQLDLQCGKLYWSYNFGKNEWSFNKDVGLSPLFYTILAREFKYRFQNEDLIYNKDLETIINSFVSDYDKIIRLLQQAGYSLSDDEYQLLIKEIDEAGRYPDRDYWFFTKEL